MKFTSQIHTYQARAEQVERITTTYSDAILIGSVARAAIVGAEASVHSAEGGSARDLDFTTTTGSGLPLTPEDQTPFPVDNLLEGLIRVESNADTATIMYDPRRPDVSVRLSASVFDPYPVKIRGVTVNTFQPDVMRRLHWILNNNRPKDNASATEFEKSLRDIEYTKIPDVTFEPLRALGDMVRRDPSLRRQHSHEQRQIVYRKIFPAQLRGVLHPIVQMIKNTPLLSTRL